jgi:hypothetical protein
VTMLDGLETADRNAPKKALGNLVLLSLLNKLLICFSVYPGLNCVS